MNLRQIILQLEENNPNEEGGVYQQAISVLYAVAYTLMLRSSQLYIQLT